MHRNRFQADPQGRRLRLSAGRRQFAALLAAIAMSIAIGGMACSPTIEQLDKSDETFGAT